jgi:hypothetical protein
VWQFLDKLDSLCYLTYSTQRASDDSLLKVLTSLIVSLPYKPETVNDSSLKAQSVGGFIDSSLNKSGLLGDSLLKVG